ncbi:MAG: DUF2231 domain-containing protein [bacterium]
MNIHPIFVHFPIALLAIYAILECFHFRKIMHKIEFFYIKFFLLITGTIGALISLSTGESASILHRDVHSLVRVHSTYATLTTIIFGILLAVYIFDWVYLVYDEKLSTSKLSKIWSLKKKIIKTIFPGPVIIILAILGLITLIITGALGGAIVYGASGDPITAFVYKIFFP